MLLYPASRAIDRVGLHALLRDTSNWKTYWPIGNTKDASIKPFVFSATFTLLGNVNRPYPAATVQAYATRQWKSSAAAIACDQRSSRVPPHPLDIPVNATAGAVSIPLHPAMSKALRLVAVQMTAMAASDTALAREDNRHTQTSSEPILRTECLQCLLHCIPQVHFAGLLACGTGPAYSG